MQIPQPHININRRTILQGKIKVRDIFKKIYQNRQINRGTVLLRKINLAASKDHLKEQLNLYLDHLSQHTRCEISQRDRTRIWNIIERNNQVAKALQSPHFRQVVKKQRQMLGKTSLGLVFCIDGRIPAIFLGGRFARHFEIPAGEITTIKRKSDGKLIPDSSDLNEALRRIAISSDDLLEIIFAHTSLSNPHHGCAAMMAKKKMGFANLKLSLEEANLEIIKQTSIPAITNGYNEFRIQLGLQPLKVVAIPALYDTDTFGIILNYGSPNSFSTTFLTYQYKDQLDEYFIKDNLVFGSFREKFTDLKFMAVNARNVLKVTEGISLGKVAPNLLKEINEYLDKFFKDLTLDQTKALRFLLIRNIAFQFLTGLLNVKKKNLDHAFAKHEESYMAVAMRGATIGKFDPQSQGFASTPSDPGQAIQNINTMMSIMGGRQNKPYILFVCNSVNSRDLKEFNQVLQRIIGSNAGLLRDIVEDKNLGAMIEKGEIIPVPVLIEEDTREVLKIVDHSGYI